jgi:hypothetical protein
MKSHCSGSGGGGDLQPLTDRTRIPGDATALPCYGTVKRAH